MVAALSRFEEHLSFYNFTSELISHCEILSTDISNLINLVQLNSVTNENCSVRLEQVEEKYVGDIVSEDPDKNVTDFSNIETSANRVDGRFEGKLVSPNIVISLIESCLRPRSLFYLTVQNLYLLYRFYLTNLPTTKFVPTPSNVNRAVLKEELEEVFGRRLRLLWCFRNEHNNASYNPFRPKSRDKIVALTFILFVRHSLGWDVEVDNRSNPVKSWDVEALPIQPSTSDRL